jgi:hypothetical protein
MNHFVDSLKSRRPVKARFQGYLAMKTLDKAMTGRKSGNARGYGTSPSARLNG